MGQKTNESTGIELATIKSIVDKLKGKIILKGNSPHGIHFSICFPMVSV